VPVVNDGETLVADSSTSTGLSYQANWAAGKNKIINGDFFVNQRNFTSVTADNTYTFDRWKTFKGGGGTATYTPQTFTPGTAPVAGYEGKNYVRIVTASQSASGDYAIYQQIIESVRTLAGQTATFSFWAKASSGTPKIAVEIDQNFGSGGSPSAGVATYINNVTLSTSWARYSVTGTVPSIAGKTLGTSSDGLSLNLWVSGGSTFNSRTGSIGNQNNTFEIWGVQLEQGSTATAFQTATGTIQGELAACQRYYYRATVDTFNKTFGLGQVYSTTQAYFLIQFPVTMRSIPSALEQNGTAADYRLNGATFNQINLSSIVTFNSATSATSLIIGTVASGLVAGNATSLMSTASNAFLGWSAEL
jgi:hypothetical protein